MPDVLAELSKYPVATPLALTGRLVVARDLAHAKLKERLDAGSGLPQYFKDHPVYMRARPRRRRGSPPGPSARRRRDAWTPMWISSSHRGAP